MNSQQTKQGILFVTGSYLIWGVIPLFWKLLEDVPSIEILWNRIIWSFLFTCIFILIIGKWKLLIADFKSLLNEPKQFISLIFASVFISVNWFAYIWAVNHDQVLQTSLGYYINPLISVLFGVLFFKEKLSNATIVAVCIAAIGVITMTIYNGQMPIIALTLAISFATYSVLKKKITLDATRGLALETLMMVPIAIIAYSILAKNSSQHLLTGDFKITLLLLCSGILTAIPLVLFAKGASKIPLYLVGFIQYLSPTIVLLLGIFLYKEPFTKIEFFAFSCIWLAVALFTISKMLETRKNKGK